MSLRRNVALAGQILVVLAALALVAGNVLGQPVLLGYVETGSMAPTLSPGDGFVPIPAALAGPVETGDVVTFRAERLNGGGLTTHRVVDETDQGYVTRGDANPFTDQDGNEPPVREEQIVAVAWRPGGSLLEIPHLGTAVIGLQDGLRTVRERLATLTGSQALLGPEGIGYLVAGLSVLLYGFDLLFGDDGGTERERERDRESPGLSTRMIVVATVVAVVGSATAAMALPAGTQTFEVISAEFEDDGPRVIQQGTSDSLTYPVRNDGLVPVVVFLEPGSDAVGVEPDRLSIGSRSRAEATLTLSAPAETGYYRRSVTEHRYLALLPESTLEALHERHSWLPVIVIDLLLAVPFYLLGTRLSGGGRLRRRSRETVSRLDRLRSRYL